MMETRRVNGRLRSMPRRIQFRMLRSVAEIIVGPPGEPGHEAELAIAEKNRRRHGAQRTMAGAMALAPDCTNPKRAFGTPVACEVVHFII